MYHAAPGSAGLWRRRGVGTAPFVPRLPRHEFRCKRRREQAGENVVPLAAVRASATARGFAECVYFAVNSHDKRRSLATVTRSLRGFWRSAGLEPGPSGAVRA
jgi:hypothetical protein